jgi:hypothetical protein
MSFIVDQRLDISAPSDLVWEVITDFDTYGQWNPFVVGCSSTLEVGSPIDMRVHIFRGFAQPQRERIFEHVPGKMFCYGVPPDALGAIRSRRCHEVSQTVDGACSYHSYFELSGWLAPLVRALFGPRLERGFESMSQGIKTRAESLLANR